MWWKKPYVNRRDWILENQGALKLDAASCVIVLMIDYLQTQHQPIDLEILSKRCAMSTQEIDATLQALSSKGYIKIFVDQGSVKFSIDGLFDETILYEFVDQSLFEIFETEFGRLLSQQELMMLNTWLKTYSQDEILDGLQTAVIYQTLTMPYINSVLANKRKEHGYDYR